jgi:2-polyprenyl-3-methyl-5-hydroxy-6-metoxy-1,4-benzoquinol methylase
MSGKSTTERLFEFYHSYTGRPTIMDRRARVTIFKSLRRVLRGWLPADRSTPILDIACGEGSLLRFLQEMGYRDLRGCDISPENVEICHRLGLTFVQQCDALCLAEMPDIGRYGAIFAMDMLEHLPKERAAGFLEQVRKLLLPGGFVIIQTLNMGSFLGWLHRYGDLSHEFGVSEKSAVDLLMLAGFSPAQIEMRPAWNATTLAGHLREAYLRLLHWVISAAEGAGRPRIPTMNLQIRASVP